MGSLIYGQAPLLWTGGTFTVKRPGWNAESKDSDAVNGGRGLGSRQSLSFSSRCTLSSNRCVSACNPWPPLLKLLSNLLFEKHFRKITRILVLRLSGHIQYEAAVIVPVKILNATQCMH